MRKTLSLLLYLTFVELLILYLVVGPVSAFQASSSTTGYVRTLNASGASSMFAASRASQLSTIASAASAAGGTSLAIRLVTGAGWVGLGVAAGLLMYQMVYTPTELAAVKTAASPLGIPAYIPDVGTTVNLVQVCPGGLACPAGSNGFMRQTIALVSGAPNFGCGVAMNNPTGWTLFGVLGLGVQAQCDYFHPSANPNGPALVAPTSTQIHNYLSTLPSSNALSLEANTQVAGVGVASQTADQVVTQPVTAAEVTTQVIPATSVGPADVVVNKDATAPAGPVPTPTATQTTTGTNTTTTTTVTNPDGSTTATSTTTQTDDAPVSSCSVGNHEPRSFGGILQTHMDTWKGSGLLSALNLLGTLVWPTTSPTYTLTSSFLGTFTFDFTAWSGMFLAIRSVIIAIAGFVAYKIIFVGGRA